MGTAHCCHRDDVPEITVKLLDKVLAQDSGLDGLVLGFECPDGSIREVVVASRPFGIHYSDSVPITVTEVLPQSDADDLGVKRGWSLRTIGGEDLDGKSTSYVLTVLLQNRSVLPFIM
mmetsp:Transcript_29617/g.78437  ORF Transcript_29617/g.78437 Transcript_29617/m.78437 type:complete len:118 (-) Transcript_29617:405-758(-)